MGLSRGGEAEADSHTQCTGTPEVIKRRNPRPSPFNMEEDIKNIKGVSWTSPSNMEQDICNIMCVCCFDGSFVLLHSCHQRGHEVSGVGQKPEEIALALRSVTDLFYLVDIIFQIYQLNVTSKISINGATFRLERVKSAKKILLSCIVIDTFAVLPVPQTRVGILVKAAFNFFPFILAGHVAFLRKSLGQNLEPSSSNQWENVFAVFTLLSGMMLFLIYLNATLQTLSVQLEKIRSDERIFRRKMQLISPEIDLWLSKNDLPKDLKMVSGRTEKHLRTVIVENVQRHLQENKDVDVENILAVLPLRHRRGIMSLLRLTSLKKVSMLESMDEKVLKAISEHLKLETYNEGSYIVPEGEPLEKMMFITQGTAWSYPPTPSSKGGITITTPNTKWLEKGDFYGEELLIWALKSTPSSELPMSTRILKSQTKVEAFAIRAKDLKTIVAKFWWHFRAELRHLEEFQLEHWHNLAASSVQENWRRYCARANKRKLRNWRSKFIQIN
ncbi:unnamed protein product [Prunus armeniaca]|uniref:Cyclic nucleotide-binding domain-containing protein n=1 Tax=Prunus armeniaca TaxID=36596 RepID=A0A6J5VCT9_PRUAR|nr:unnamed protein product [Prunus armeniaca]